MRPFVKIGIFVVPLFLASCTPKSEDASQTAEDPAAALLAEALSATYPGHGAGAAVVDWEGNVLQEGTNGFTCMPTAPMLADRGTVAPMCLDEVWMEWADAWANKQPFSAARLGIAYMLAGDGGASNIDPYAEGPTDDNEWIVEGPHLMLLVPDESMLEGITTDPSAGGPYVMWRGTDYAHVMVPVEMPPEMDVSSALGDALSAADAGMQSSVAVMDWEGNVLQEGSGAYTCMPTPPMLADGETRSPMCLDSEWLEWANAWQNKQPFAANRLGISYMLSGDGGASNIDPYATGPTDDNEWVVEGAHLMLVVPDEALLSGISTDPTTGGPYVMWRGTDYAHVMVPVADVGVES
jgi:hypothetical protein